MKNKSLKPLLAFLTIGVLSLSACGSLATISACGSLATNENDNGLELLYFGKPLPEAPEEPQTLNRAKDAPHYVFAGDVEGESTNPEEDDVYEVDFGCDLVLEAYVKNTNRLSFVDIVIYSASTNEKYVFNDGNGDYVVRTSTVLRDGVWTTKIYFPWVGWEITDRATSSCMYDTYIEIEEINFISLAGAVAHTNIAENNTRRVNIHKTDNEDSYSHTWSEWEHRDPTCEEWAGRYRCCAVCGKEHFENVWRYQDQTSIDEATDGPVGHIYSGEWEIIQHDPDRVGACDYFQSVGTCSRCGEVISKMLGNGDFAILCMANDFSCDLVIPEGIKVLEYQIFIYFDYLRTVRLPKSLKRIEGTIFPACWNLTDVYFEGSVPPDLPSDGSAVFEHDLFEREHPLNIHVPTNALEAYQSIGNWSWQEHCVPHLVADLPANS